MDNVLIYQRTPEWIAARLGKITSTRFAGLLKGKEAFNATLAQIFYEIDTGKQWPVYVNEDMLRGEALEEEARQAYEFVKDVDVKVVGFIKHPLEPFSEFVGVSPDGFVGDDGIIEIKCPRDKNHILNLYGGFDETYKAQVQGMLWVTGRQWCDFVSYNPDYPHKIAIHRVEANELYIARMEEKVKEAIKCIIEKKINR